MVLSEVNERLFSLYESRLDGLRSIYENASERNYDDFANPLLMQCHEEYVNSPKKLFFVGQETCSWFSDPNNKVLSSDDIRNLQQKYLDFMLPKTYSSPFWNFIHDVSFCLSGGVVNYMWSNVWKIGKKYKAGKAYGINDLETDYFNVGKAEMKILNPDYVVFLTGPKYDRDIESHFGKLTIKENYDECFDQLEIEGFDCKFFRLYHPNYHNYLGTTRKAEYKNKLIQLLKE